MRKTAKNNTFNTNEMKNEAYRYALSACAPFNDTQRRAQ